MSDSQCLGRACVARRLSATGADLRSAGSSGALALMMACAGVVTSRVNAHDAIPSVDTQVNEEASDDRKGEMHDPCGGEGSPPSALAAPELWNEQRRSSKKDTDAPRGSGDEHAARG